MKFSSENLKNVEGTSMERGKKRSKGKAQKVARVGVRKESGYLYFVDRQGDVSRATMSRGGRKRKASSSARKSARKTSRKSARKSTRRTAGRSSGKRKAARRRR